MARRRCYNRREVVFHEGDIGESAVVVLSGCLAVRKTGPGGEAGLIGVLGPGEVAGELALVQPAVRRTVTVSAASGATTFGNVYTQLLEYIVSADLVFYLLLVLAVIILRRNRPGAERPYRTWGYPLVPLVSIVLATLLIVDLTYLAPTTSGIGILIVLTGIPVYLAWRKRPA